MEQQKVGLEIRSLNNLILRYFEFSSHRKEIDTITGNNGWIIGFLAKNEDRDIFQKDLEKHFTITRSTASKVLSLMEQKGLIRREAVSRDARLKKIVLTERAEQAKELMSEDSERMEKALQRGFTEEEKQTLLSYLQRMKVNIASVQKKR